jgi:hypothetical protein
MQCPSFGPVGLFDVVVGCAASNAEKFVKIVHGFNIKGLRRRDRTFSPNIDAQVINTRKALALTPRSDLRFTWPESARVSEI